MIPHALSVWHICIALCAFIWLHEYSLCFKYTSGFMCFMCCVCECIGPMAIYVYFKLDIYSLYVHLMFMCYIYASCLECILPTLHICLFEYFLSSSICLFLYALDVSSYILKDISELMCMLYSHICSLT